jgi:ATP-dependent helicase/nuclease subunit A
MTAAQRSAADPRASAWVAASAGTGKTTVLTDRVLRLLLDGAAPEKLLCLTFTRAAAAEMRIRLGQRLALWSGLDNEALAEALGKLIGGPFDPELIPRARALLGRVLDAPGGMKIETIHGFCQSLLRRFPLEAGIAPHFSVADERDAAELLRRARDSVLRRAREEGGDAVLTNAFREVSSHVNDLDFLDLLASLARERGKLRRIVDRVIAGREHEETGIDDAELLAAPGRWLGLASDATDEGAIAVACARDRASGGANEAALRRACTALAEGSDNDQERGLAIAHWLDGDSDARAEGFDDYCALFVTQATPPAARARLITKKALETDPTVLEALEGERERMLAVALERASLGVARSTAALLLIGRRLVSAYDEAKQRSAVLDFDDQIERVRELLENQADAAWVLFKLDGGLDHILLDEAQDTAPGQWDIVARLCEEFFAGTGAREVPRSLFVVGDEKQSIFSFQGAEPHALDRMREHFAARVEAAGGPWRQVPLELSFRSTPAVLRAVDAVFALAEAAEGVSLSGAPIRHEAHRAGQAGLVELWPTIAPEESATEDPWQPPLARPAPPTPSARLAAAIAGRIQGWIETGERLESRDRAIRPGDIMVLVQRRTGFLDELARALKKAGVAVAGVDRLVLSEQIAVMDLIALGRFLLLPDDDLTLAALLKSPLIGLSEDELFDLAAGRAPRSLWRALSARCDETPRFAAAHERLAGLLARADMCPPFELYAELLGAGGGRLALIGRLGHEAEDPIDEFLDLALAYQRQHAPSLQGFLAWVEAGGGEIKRDLEQGRDEVRLMTVHGAKGLQAPIVILPDTVRKPDRLSPLLWDEAEHETRLLWPGSTSRDDPASRAVRERAKQGRDEEYRRLLYVALTRAEDRLYLAGYESRRGLREGCWYDLVRRALEPVAERVRFEFGDPAAAGWGGEGLRLAGPQEATPVRDGQAVADSAGAPPLPEFAQGPPAPEPEPARPLTPSRTSLGEPARRSPLGADEATTFRRGRLAHRLLELLPELALKDREAACARAVALPGHGLGADEAVAVAAEVRRVIEEPDFAALFAPGSRAEAPLVALVNERVIAGQIDRLVVTDEAVLAVDYKTNRPPPERVEDVAVAYLAQMAAYRAALQRIYPDRPVRCTLLWTDAPRLMALPDALLDGFAP